MSSGPAPVAGHLGGPRRPISYAHLLHLSDEVGLFEHAKLTRPRLEHGYCVDDVARGLLVVVREPQPPPELVPLRRIYLDFVLGALAPDGQAHNRRRCVGGWTDEPTLQDCWGRALWGLGSAVARAPELADEALAGFEQAAARRSPWRRAMAFAAMGAAEVVSVLPRHASARRLLGDAARLIDTRVMAASAGSSGSFGHDRTSDDNTDSPPWPWPEPRLRYANAVLPETLLAAGSLLGVQHWAGKGLARLRWLVNIETAGDDGHLSVTPVGGWAPGEPRPGFDQQAIEVAALADACARAADHTGDPGWADDVRRCEAWFWGANDVGVAMLDEVSGGGFDGLKPAGRNENEGAESTLALLSTLQQAHRLPVPAA